MTKTEIVAKLEELGIKGVDNSLTKKELEEALILAYEAKGITPPEKDGIEDVEEGQKEDPSPFVSCSVVRNFKHDGEEHKIGDTCEFTKSEAKRLEALGVLTFQK